jgi:hypothetical protein
MSPFMGKSMGFDPATLALLDAALTGMCADFQLAKTKALIAKPVAAPPASEIDTPRIRTPKQLASTVAPKRSGRETTGNPRFNKGRGWYLR